MAQAIREVAWNAANDPQKSPIKQGVSRAEIDTDAFECSIGSRGMAARQFKAHDGNAIQNTADGSIS